MSVFLEKVKQVNSKSISDHMDVAEVFHSDTIYVLLTEEEGEWFERTLGDLYVIRDNADLAAAIELLLEPYGYIFIQGKLVGSASKEQSGFFVVVDFRETLFPDNTGTITFRLFPVKTAKAYFADTRRAK